MVKESPQKDKDFRGYDIDNIGSITLTSGATINEFSTDGTLSGDSDTVVPTEKAVKTYVDNNGGGVGVSKLSDLSDVNTSTATNRNVLVADGVDFESRALLEADISDLQAYLLNINGENIDALADVVITTPADGELFVYDTTTSKWINNTLAEAGVSAVGHTHVASNITDFDTEVANNTAVAANTAKISFDTTSSTRLANTSGTNTGDQDLSGKQDNITLTTTGSSGAATLVGATLNIPQYAGVTTLSGLSDVDDTVATPSDGDIIVYRSAGSDWVLEAKPAGGSNPALNDITDVTVTTVADNELLAYDSATSEWINQTPTEAGFATVATTGAYSDLSGTPTIPSSGVDFDPVGTDNSTNVSLAGTGTYISLVGQTITVDPITESDISDLGSYLTGITGEPLSDLSDVTITTIASGELLKWNGTAWVNNTLVEAGVSAVGHTHTASEVTDFDTEVANNSAVAANTAKVTYPSVDSTKVGFISVTQAVDLDTMESNIATNNAKVGVTTQISNVVEDTTPQLGGNLDWNSKNLILDGVSTSGVSAGNVTVFNGTNWVQADASASSTCDGMLAIAIDTDTIVTHGIYTTSGLTAGSKYYVSETAGAITTTAPTTIGAIVRIVGYALSTTELFVDPDKSYVENV